MKNILNNIFSTIAGLSIFILLTCIIVNMVSRVPFIMTIMRDVVVGQIFILIMALAVLVITNVQSIIDWFNEQ